MRGVAPSTPSRDIVPAPGSGYCSAYLTNIFPLLLAARSNSCKKTIVSLRIGCGTAATTGPAAERRQPDATHPGKTIKRSGERIHSLNRSFSFSLCPWCCFSSPQLPCGNNPVRYDCMSHTGSRADCPGAGYRGRIGPCLCNGSTGGEEPLCFVPCSKISGTNGQKCGKWGRKMRKKACNFGNSPV